MPHASRLTPRASYLTPDAIQLTLLSFVPAEAGFGFAELAFGSVRSFVPQLLNFYLNFNPVSTSTQGKK
jgi:hypothetical protein